MNIGKIEYAPNYGKKGGVTVPLDTAARRAVEGVPCYMYGIRATEDELPVVEQSATDMPGDILDKADAVIERGYNEGLVDAIARAILAERKRCADIAKRIKRVVYGNTDSMRVAGAIASEIEAGQ